MPELEFVHRYEPGADDLTILALHGTGGDENDLLPLARMLHPTANVLSPRGQVLEGGMPRFFRRLAMGVFDVEDLKVRSVELVRFVDAAAEAYGFRRDLVVAVGYSNGANIAGSILLLEPKAFAGAALLHAMKPFEVDPLPTLEGTPIFLSGGQRDQMIPADQTVALKEMLGSAGADLTMYLGPRRP
ncbi:MAG: phospholipase/carboxylesterase [Actinomycetota bacterium]|jgi:phospholipase/carboxylesterase/glyoxalase family protein|nr:phospholipase/carboxylesterase [Actinomycetota bacterium]